MNFLRKLSKITWRRWWISVYGSMAEWHWQGKKEALGWKPLPAPSCTPPTWTWNGLELNVNFHGLANDHLSPPLRRLAWREATKMTTVAKQHCRTKYRYAPHNDVSVNDGPHIRRCSHKIMIYNIILTIVLHLPTVFSTVTCCTGW